LRCNYNLTLIIKFIIYFIHQSICSISKRFCFILATFRT